MTRPWMRPAAAAAAGLALAAAALIYVPEGQRGILETRSGALRLIVRPGLHLRWPPFSSLSLYPDQPLRLSGTVGAASREGAAVEGRYAVTLRMPDGGLERLHRSRAGRPLSEFLVQALEGAARAHAATQPLPALASPVGVRAAGAALQAALEPMGVWLEAEGRLSWEAAEPPEVEEARAALRARVQDTRLKVLLVGLDGADWGIIEPLIAGGRLPVLARLKREGAWGTLLSEHPMLSPLLWTTIATGRSPERHGVMDFLMRDPHSGRMVPISAAFRRVKALWNVLTDFGMESDFVAWWATWPAERVRGTMISDRLSYSLFPFVEQEASPSGTVYPEAYLEQIRPRLVSDRDITYDEVRRFVDISADDFRTLRAWVERQPRAAYTDPVNHLTRILAATRNYHTIGLDLLERGQKPLTAVYYQGIDEVNHRFAHFAPPRMDRISAEEFRRYSRAVERFYEYQDELLGELFGRIERNTVVLVLSDHGFAHGAARPRDFTPSIEGRPARWHTLEGVRLLWGPAVRPGPLGEGRLVDVAPTVLRLLGVPLSGELEGKAWEEALEAGFLRRFPAAAVESYETLGRPLAAAAAASGAGSEEFVQALRSLGYIGEQQAAEAAAAPGGEAESAPAGATAAYHANLAGILLRKGDVEGAEREFKAALAKEPRFSPAFGGLAEIEARRDRHEESLRLVLQGLDQSPDPDDSLFAAATRTYIKLKKEGVGAQRLEGFVRRFPRRAAPRICRGMLLLRAGREREAEGVLREALQVDPASLSALQELFELYREQERLPELERALSAALERSPRAVPLRNWLAWVRTASGDPRGAEGHFRAALEDDPDSLETLANLGSLLIDQNRPEEAAEILERAVRKEPRHWQSRVNLIIALGKAGRPEDARKAYDQAGEEVKGRPEILNALAYACYLNGRDGEALESVRRSLAIDPDQPEARRLLETLEGG